MSKPSTVLLVTFAALLSATPVGAAHALAPASGASRQVNVSSDSAPGWIPSTEQEDAARKTVAAFLAALDGGRTREAYGFLTKEHQSQLPYDAFSRTADRFRADAGDVVERRITTVTWSKDPSAAPYPGVYAAIDLVSRFQRVDRHCGYLILHQPATGGAFHVMRQEDNYIDNATAQKSPKAELDATWARLSANCPNFAASQTDAPQVNAPLPEATESTIGYATVAAALEGLHRRKDIEFSTRDGWTVAFDEASSAVWSFAPPGHPAYPAAVKRQAVEVDGGTSLRMQVLCEADKASCDDLVRSFQDLNTRMEQSLKSGR